MRNLHATRNWPTSGDSMCERARVSQDSARRAPEATSGSGSNVWKCMSACRIRV